MLAALVFCMVALVAYYYYRTRTVFPKQDEDKPETAKVGDSNKQLRLDTDGDDKSGINIGWSQIGTMIASKKDIMSPVSTFDKDKPIIGQTQEGIGYICSPRFEPAPQIIVDQFCIKSPRGNW